MNDKIKDAWEKAAQAYSGDSWAEQTAFLEKFAELIVRECADIVEGFTIEQEVALDDYQEYEASAVLKEHFGVEE